MKPKLYLRYSYTFCGAIYAYAGYVLDDRGPVACHLRIFYVIGRHR